MSAVPLLPNLALGVVEKLSQTVEVGNVEEWLIEEVAGLTSFCRDTRRLVQEAQQSVERDLSRGVEGGLFVARYDPVAATLDVRGKNVARLVEEARTCPLPAQVQEFISEFQALGQDLADFQRFLVTVLARAKAPRRPLDWERIKEAEAAYARGETTPFQRAAKGRRAE